MASSRVGATTIASGNCRFISRASKFPSINLLITGRRKAAVFPDPVWAQAIISFAARMLGIAHFWTGVGCLYPSVFRFCNSCSDSLLSLNVFFSGEISLRTGVQSDQPCFEPTDIVHHWNFKMKAWLNSTIVFT